jgi:hypothetical protein
MRIHRSWDLTNVDSGLNSTRTLLGNGGAKSIGMHSGIGSAASGYIAIKSKKLARRAIQLSLNRSATGLDLIAAKICAEVG